MYLSFLRKKSFILEEMNAILDSYHRSEAFTFGTKLPPNILLFGSMIFLLLKPSSYLLIILLIINILDYLFIRIIKYIYSKDIENLPTEDIEEEDNHFLSHITAVDGTNEVLWIITPDPNDEEEISPIRIP